MAKQSAGILLFRLKRGLEVLLVHPGGPFWARRDAGAWSIPKGEFGQGENPIAAALREFSEETGVSPDGDPLSLGTAKQAGGKIVHAWALEGDCDASLARSNLFEMEWPPKSGRQRQFPEIDRAQWFRAEEARERLISGQRVFIDRLLDELGFHTDRGSLGISVDP